MAGKRCFGFFFHGFLFYVLKTLTRWKDIWHYISEIVMAVVKVKKGSWSILRVPKSRHIADCFSDSGYPGQSQHRPWAVEHIRSRSLFHVAHGEKQYLCLLRLCFLLGCGFPTALKMSTYHCQHVRPAWVSSLHSCRPEPLGHCSSCEMLGQGKT